MYRKRVKPQSAEAHTNGHSAALAALPPTAADDELLLIDRPVSAPPPTTLKRPHHRGREGDGERVKRGEP